MSRLSSPLREAAVFPSTRQPPHRQAKHPIIYQLIGFCLSRTTSGGGGLWRRPHWFSWAQSPGEAASPDLGGQRKCWYTLWSRRPKPSHFCQTSCEKQRRQCFNASYFFVLSSFSKFYLETKWVSSGEKATLRTQDPCPLSVPAKLACCLTIISTNHWFTSENIHLLQTSYCSFLFQNIILHRKSFLFKRSQSTSFQLNLHVVYFDVTVVGGCDQQLGVGGESEGSDGHGVTWREGKQSACINRPDSSLKIT